MSAEKIRQRESHLTIAAIVMLAFAVFSWGVRYKLSLYNPSAHMSEAKLLSQEERPSLSQVIETSIEPMGSAAPIALFAYLLGTMLAGLFSLEATFLQGNTRRHASLPRQCSQNFFFFRPPPPILAS